MNELVRIKGNDVFTDSAIVASECDNQHDSVVKQIMNHKEKFERLGELKTTDFKSGVRGPATTIYLLNEPQASFLITLLRNTDKVIDFKFNLVSEFYRMRRFLMEKQTAEWQQARLTGKKVRRDETDVILTKLIPLAESQGSKNAGKLYMTYSKLVNMTLGIEAGQRDGLPLAYVEAIKFLERAIENIISIEVDKGTKYKEIYQICKAKCQIVKDLAFLPSLKLLG